MMILVRKTLRSGVTAAKQQMPEAIMPFKTSNFCLLAVTAAGITSAHFRCTKIFFVIQS